MITFYNLNLKHRHDLRCLIVSNYISQKVSREKVVIWDAIYGGDYADADAICDDAVKSGWKLFDKLRWIHGRGDLTLLWNILNILIDIRDNCPTDFAYFNYDDSILLVSYAELCKVVEKLQLRREPFLFFQMDNFFFKMEDPLKPVLPPDFNWNPIPEDSRIFKGALYGDFGILMSKAGVVALLDALLSKIQKISENPSDFLVDTDTCTFFEYLPYEVFRNIPGVYTCKPYDSEDPWVKRYFDEWPILSNGVEVDRITVNKES